MRFNRVICARCASLLDFHRRSQTAVDAGEHHGGFGFFHSLADLFRFPNLSLNQLKPAVDVGIRDGSHHVRIPARRSTRFFLGYLHQSFRTRGISSERARDRSHSVSVHLHGFRFDILEGLKMPVRPVALHRLLVYGAIAALRVAFRGAGGINSFGL